ncbi:MAG TPA: response regulator [Polyangiaceae bacterium]|nr:response regulator [Polyangiaceae bacterium]
MSRRGWRILLADDDVIAQEAVSYAAAKAGHAVTAATTGAQALELAVSMQPDLIVLDIGFPDADGRDVLAKLKADKRTARIPVLVWSGRNVNESDSRIALALGAEDYVEKNNAHMLIQKLERVLLRFA